MDDLIKRLQAKARIWASNITKKAHGNLEQYRKLIRVQSKVVTSKDTVSIESTAYPIARSKYGDVKNVARAYEYGSGIRSRVRSRKSPKQQPDGRIKISPRRKKVLAFGWEKLKMDTNSKTISYDLDTSIEEMTSSRKFVGFTPDGRAMFRYVDHPGVAAANGGKGYLAPAVREVNKKIRKEISPEMKASFNGVIKRAFSKGK